jgi:S-adenosylhomocysteine hydrolase
VLLFTAQDESEIYGDGWAKLKAMGVKVDVLTDEQETYLKSWEMGT